MSRFEYKVVPAPSDVTDPLDGRADEERLACALESLMNQLGADGWHYQRMDALPLNRHAAASRFCGLMVFRRPMRAERVARARSVTPFLLEQKMLAVAGTRHPAPHPMPGAQGDEIPVEKARGPAHDAALSARPETHIPARDHAAAAHQTPATARTVATTPRRGRPETTGAVLYLSSYSKALPPLDLSPWKRKTPAKPKARPAAPPGPVEPSPSNPLFGSGNSGTDNVGTPGAALRMRAAQIRAREGDLAAE